MKGYRIPKIEIQLFPSREYVLENQVQVFMQLLIGGGQPTASYVYKKNNNKVMLFMDGILMSAKFKGMKFVDKLCESIAHETAHSHVWQDYHRNFHGNEAVATSFAERAKPPPPFGKDHEMNCKKCCKETWWEVCPVCSIEELL